MSGKNFSDVDGLILATISCNPNIDIVTWIAFIDAYYRIIISYDELNASLDTLQKSGMVTFIDNSFCTTDKAAKVLSGRNRMGTTSWIFKVQERLTKLSFDTSYDVLYNLSINDYDSALEQYRILWKK